jgi:hypothetical protein
MHLPVGSGQLCAQRHRQAPAQTRQAARGEESHPRRERREVICGPDRGVAGIGDYDILASHYISQISHQPLGVDRAGIRAEQRFGFYPVSLAPFSNAAFQGRPGGAPLSQIAGKHVDRVREAFAGHAAGRLALTLLHWIAL